MDAEALRERLAATLAERRPRRIPDGAADARAAVALVLRPTRRAGGGTGDDISLLLVRRAEVEGDPWSGHVALPGGRRQPGDRDLVATAIRETREETSLRLARHDVLGPLDDTHPLTRPLPSVAVTPFVAWYEGEEEVRANVELRGHLWVPLPTLLAPAHRSAFTLRRGDRVASFPTIEYRDYVVWGLTFEILADFLRLLRNSS